MPVTKTEAVKNLLTANTHPDLAALYQSRLEVQVSVAQDGGEKIEKEFKGRQYAAYTDGLSEWKSFRIPRNANSNPEDNDSPMLFDLSAHVEGIGMTGWDWQNRVSRWVSISTRSRATPRRTGASSPTRSWPRSSGRRWRSPG
jgi:hypothetical protein